VPAGVVSEGGDWFFQEFTHTTGVTHLGIEGHDATGETGADAEKKKILDMFKE
jgi:penicillin-binding protein 1A